MTDVCGLISSRREVEIHILHFMQNSTSHLDEDSQALFMDPFVDIARVLVPAAGTVV